MEGSENFPKVKLDSFTLPETQNNSEEAKGPALMWLKFRNWAVLPRLQIEKQIQSLDFAFNDSHTLGS